MCKMSKQQVLSKKVIDKSWELSKESFQDQDALDKLRELEKEIIPKLSSCIIMYVDNYNQDRNMREYYSFYRIYSPRGKYLFSLPARLDLPTAEWEKVNDIIVRHPSDSSQSSNGGDYYAGFRVWKLSHKNLELYQVQYNRMLYSDFEDQGWEGPEICNSGQEVAELTGGNIEGD
jgi:hypothetical protein